ncbi:MAG TPA: tetratricopeptide repeat protein [Chloroflexia bacterium]|jgi:cytochrome c-type biogenesis protein CcmH/NrfG
MSPLGKRIVVFTMLWVFLVMILLQVYDNVTGRGMPVRSSAAPLAVDPTVEPDKDVARLAELQSCVASDPNNLQCNLDLASLYYEAGQYPQAQVNYERAVKLDPHNVGVLTKLAGAYIYQQKFPQAVATLQDAAAIQPTSPEIQLLLGLSLSKLDPPRMDDAAAAWRKVIELAPDTSLAAQARQYLSEAGRQP